MKYLLAAALALATCTFASAAAPANDKFLSATKVTGNALVLSGSNVDATVETGEPDHAALPSRNSVWWAWTPTSSGVALVETQGSNYDTTLAVYRGASLVGLTPVAYSDDIDLTDVTSRVIFNVTANVTYYIAVAGYNGSTGSISLTCSVSDGSSGGGTNNTSLVVNDNYANRIELAGEYTTASGINVLATEESSETKNFMRPDESEWYYSADSKSLWWKWTAPRSGKVTITNQMRAISQYADASITALLMVFLIDTEDIAELESVPLGNFSSGEDITSVSLTLSVVAGQTLQIKVGSLTGLAEGALANLTVSMDTVSSTNLNDRFVKRTDITGNNVTIATSNSAATAEIGEPDHAGSSASKSLWWTWQAPENGYLTVLTSTTTLDTRLAVYSGTDLATLNEIDSNNDYLLSETSRVHIRVYKGLKYQIALDSLADEDGGDVSLNLSFTSDAAVIVEQPTDNLAILGDLTAVFTVRNTGSDAIYDWQRKAAGTTTWVHYDSGTVDLPDDAGLTATSTLTVSGPLTASMDGDQFRCVITNNASQIISKTATLRVVSLVTYTGSNPTIDLPDFAGDSVKYSAKSLPKGLTLNSATGTISGRITALPGTYTITYYAQTTTGGVTTKTATYTYVILVQAYPTELTGSFEGLLQDGMGLPIGKVQLTVGGTGAFTGTLTYGAKPLKLKGSLVLDSATAPTGALSTLSLTGGLSLAITINNDDTFDAALSNTGGALGDLAGEGVALAPFSTLFPCPWAGAYTLAFSEPTSGPEGSGYSTATVQSSGNLVLAGQLADGTKITASLPNDINDPTTYRMYLQPYKKGGGYLAGWLPLSVREVLLDTNIYHVSAIGGMDVYWAKGSNAKDKAYPAGFGPVSLTAVMEPWTAPSNSFLLGLLGLVSLDPQAIGDFSLVLDHSTSVANTGANADLLPQLMNLSSNNTVTVRAADSNPTNPRGLSLTIKPATGYFSGSFTLADKRKVSLQGVLLQNGSGTSPNTFGRGFYLVPPVKTKPATGSTISGDVQFIGPDIP